MSANVAKHFGDAKQALKIGDPREAFMHLRWTLEYPSPIVNDPALWQDVVTLFAEVCDHIAGPALAAKVRAVISAPDKQRRFGFGAADPQKLSPQALYDVGYALVEEKLDGIGATFLAKANELSPGNVGVLTELVTALEGAGLHAEARRILEATPPSLLASSFMCAYLLAFDTLLTADVPLARKRHAALKPADDAQRWMTDAIDTMIARAEAVRAAGNEETLSLRDLRGWHFVVNGTFLLHCSPFGFHEGMHGRYAFTQDSYARCKAGLERLAAVCTRAGFAPAAILAMPDKHSRVLAHAASAIFRAPLAAWADDPGRAGLIVAYDMQTIDLGEQGMRTLHAHAPQQAFYEHAACWTAPFPIAADACHYLHQFNEAAWGERMQIDHDTREPAKLPADERPAEAIAADVLAAEEDGEEGVPNEPAELERLVDVARSLPEAMRPAMLRQTGRRFRCRPDSPVKSNRFI
jgi:hypothetical protein